MDHSLTRSLVEAGPFVLASEAVRTVTDAEPGIDLLGARHAGPFATRLVPPADLDPRAHLPAVVRPVARPASCELRASILRCARRAFGRRRISGRSSRRRARCRRWGLGRTGRQRRPTAPDLVSHARIRILPVDERVDAVAVRIAERIAGTDGAAHDGSIPRIV